MKVNQDKAFLFSTFSADSLRAWQRGISPHPERGGLATFTLEEIQPFLHSAFIMLEPINSALYNSTMEPL